MAVDKNKKASAPLKEAGAVNRPSSPSRPVRPAAARNSRSASPPRKGRAASRKESNIGLNWVEYEGAIKGREDERLEEAYNAPRALSREASRRPSRSSTPEVGAAYRRSPSPELLPVSRWFSASPASGRSSRALSPSPPSGSSPSRSSFNSPSPPVASPKGSHRRRGSSSTSPSSPGSPSLSRSPSPEAHVSKTDTPSSAQRPSLKQGPLLTNTPICSCEDGDPKCEHRPRSPPRPTSFVTLLPEREPTSPLSNKAEGHVPNPNAVQTPRVPGEETGNSVEPKPQNDLSQVPGLLEKEALLLKIPSYLIKAQASALGSSVRTSPEPQENPFVRNERFSRANIEFHVPTAVRPRSSMDSGRRSSVLDLIMQGTEVRNRGSVDASAKQGRRETVTIPVNAKQWLLQSIGLKDEQIRAMLDQMEAVPSSAADHVREVKAEWDALEARDQRLSPAAEFLRKDQALLQKVKGLLHRFTDHPHPEKRLEAGGRDEAGNERKTSFEQAEDLLTSLLAEGHMPIALQPGQGSVDQDRPNKTSDDHTPGTVPLPPSSPPAAGPVSTPGLQPRRSVSPGGSIVGKFICQCCGEINAAATPHSNVGRNSPLPKEIAQRTPSLFPSLSVPSGTSLPSLIPFDDYVVRKGMFKPDNEYKAAFSHLDKRWYSVLFPALQPGKREDVELLGAWLQHATQRNSRETPDGAFEDVESAFVLHCIAFLEIVRQVRIHCEDRGNLLLHLWRQLLRIFNQVMVLVEPRLNAAEEEVRLINEKMVAEKAIYEERYKETEVLKNQIAGLELLQKKQAYELSKIHRCRLCLSENMTPRSREELLRKARGKWFTSISDNKEDVVAKEAKESSQAVLDMGYKQIEAAKVALAEKEREHKEFKSATDRKTQEATSKKQEASKKLDNEEHKEREKEKETDKDRGTAPTSNTRDSKDKKDPIKSGWERVKKVLMDAIVGSDDVLPSDEDRRSELSGSVHAEREGSDSESSDEDTDRDSGSQNSSGGTGGSSEYSGSLDSEAAAELEARIAYLVTLPEACTQTEEEELKERHIPSSVVGYAKRPKSAPGRLETWYPKVKKIMRQNKFDEFGTDKELAPNAQESGAELDSIKGQLAKYGALAEDTIFLLESSLPVVEGALATDIKMLLRRYREITGRHAADEAEDDVFISPSRRGSGQSIAEEGDDGREGAPGRRSRRGSKKVGKKREGGYLSHTASSRSGSVQPTEETGGARPSDLKGLVSKTPVPLGFGHLMNIKVSPKNTRFMNIRQLTRLISSIYTAKIEADIIDDDSNLDRQTCCEFIYDHMLHQYGLKKLSEAAIHGMFKTIRSLIMNRQIEKAHRIRLFSRFVGFDAKTQYGERDLYVYLKTLAKAQGKVGTIFTTEQEEGQCFVNCALLYNFTDEPSLVERCGGQETASTLVEKFAAANAVKEKCSPEVKKLVKLSEVRKLDWDLLMEAVLDTKEQADPAQDSKKLAAIRKSTRVPLSKEKRQELETLFIAGDVTQEGLLTFNDFRDIISTANPSIKSQIATRMYRETLVLMDGGDRISPSAFATIAHTRGISAPADVIYIVLKRTWAKAQQRVNVNLLKDKDTKAEFDEVRNALTQMIEGRKDLNAAVQIFRAFVLKFCKSAPDAAPETVDEEEQSEEPTFNFQEE